MNDIDIFLRSSLKQYAKNIAIEDGFDQMTFEQLDLESDMLAQHISSKNLSGGFIGIYLHRSKEFIISILGILKSGNAYIPLDVQDPETRVRHIVDCSKITCIITSSNHQVKFSVDNIILIEQRSQWKNYPVCQTTPSNEFAYCIYTSGSTGKPKGVVIKKSGLWNYLKWCLSTYTSGENRGFILHSSLSYDMSITSIFLPMFLGQTLTIIPDEQASLALIKLLEEETKYNLLKLTPSHLKIIKENVSPSCLKNKVNNLIIGGEQLFYEDIAFWKHASEKTRIFNEYGPTEATVGCSVYEVQEIEKGPVPIGQPIPGSQLLVLNERFEPVPIGVTSELFIGGECLAEGYLHDNVQTQNKFIQKTILSLNKTFRLYQTGDLVRLLPQKRLVYQGRKDEQIKINGYRVEPEEIAANIKLHGDVKEVHVLFDKINQCLIAYFVANDFVPTDQELSEFVKEKLPQYMRPKYYIHLKEFPLTKNGKLDVHALPVPSIRSVVRKPETSLQQKLCTIWSEILGKNEVTLQDNFFELGGDSITCILMIGKAKLEGIHIKLKDIYDYPTIASLESHCQYTNPSTQVITHNKERQKKYTLSPIQQWFFSQQFEVQNHYNQSSLIKLHHRKDFTDVIQTLLSRHSVFFLNFKQEEVNWVQEEQEMLQVNITSYTLEEEKNDLEQIRIIGDKAQKSLNITQSPIGHVLIFKSVDYSYVLFIFHHLIIDWVSWGILYRELDALLKGLKLQKWQGTSYSHWISSLPKKQHDLIKQTNKLLPANENILQILDEGYMFLLHKIVNKSAPFQLIDFIISALCLVFSKNNQCSIIVEGHGRLSKESDQDLSNTIGWFTELNSIPFSFEQINNYKEVVNSVHKKRIQKVHPELSVIPDVCFNYLGNVLDKSYSTFEVIKDCFSNNISDKNHLPVLLNINAWIENDQLKLQWFFNHLNISKSTAQELIKKYEMCLKKIVRFFFNEEENPPLPTKNEQYALGPLQNGLYYSMIKSPNHGRYVIQRIFELPVSIHLESLKKAWIHTIEQFEVLRNSFIWKQSSPYQVPINQFDLDWIEDNFEEEQEQKLTLLFEIEKKKPFDFLRPPLMRFLVCKGKKRNYLAWTIHHIIIDGWSSVLVLDFVEKSYKKISQGKFLEIEPIKPYKYYIDWVEQSNKKVLLDFWKNYLHKHRPSFISDIGRSLPRSTTSRYENWDGQIDKILTEQLKAKAKIYGVTLNSLIQASWAVFLHKHLKTQEVTFGITFSGRVAELEGIEEMVGVLINTLPLRLHLEAASFKELCKEAHQKTVQVQLQGGIPLHEVQSLTQGQHKKLFDHILVFENFPFSSQDKERILNLSHQYATVVETEYPLTIVLMPEEEIKLEISYDTGLFDRAMIIHFAMQWMHILSCICQESEIQLAEISLSNLQEAQNTWNLFNSQTTNNTTSLSKLFASNCSVNSKSALVENDQQVSFLDLENFTEYLSNKIQICCDPQASVGIFLERSIYFPLAAWSCIKAGIPFVPLETKFPRDRIDYILRDAKCDLILTMDSEKASFKETFNFLCIDNEYNDEMRWKKHKRIHGEIDENGPAYIIYTSGSSGYPKGVVVSRAALANYLQWSLMNYIANNENGSILHSSIAFDMSITALFTPLLAGQILYILPEGKEITSLIDLLNNAGKFSFLKLTPSHLKILQAENRLGELNQKVTNLILGGEQLNYEDIAYFKNCNSPITIFNEYGPTEATVGCCVYKWKSDENFLKGPVPIGQPIFNTQLYVYNSQDKLCTNLEEGELYIKGMGLALGYINFQGNDRSPFIEKDGTKMYRTGDIVRLSAEQNLVYLKREGRQIKFNGYRIELEEIEFVLKQHGDIEAAIVDFDSTNQLLKTYFVPGEFTPSLEEIQMYMKAKLPAYMLPGQYIQIENIPLNSNGKVDLQKLKNLGSQLELIDIKKKPKTRLESELHTLWLKILNKEEIGIEDHFFSIGGHSILAVRMLADVKKLLYPTISLQDFLVNPTIRSLAEMIEKGQKEVDFPIWLPLSDIEYNEALILIHPGGGLSYIYALLPSKAGLDEVGVFAINSPHFGKTSSFQSIEEMAQEYVSILKDKVKVKTLYLGGWSFGGNVAYEMARKIQQEGLFDVEAVVLFDSFNHTSAWDASQLRSEEKILQNINRFLEAKGFDVFSKYAQDLKNEMLRNALLSRKFYPQAYDGLIILFKAEADDMNQKDYPFNGWETVANNIKVEKLSCHHSTLFDLENVAEVSKKLSDYVNQKALKI